MNIRNTPFIDDMTAHQWALAAADSVRSLASKPRQALIRMLLDAIRTDGKRVLPNGSAIYVARERKLHTQLAVQHLAANLLAAAHELKGTWELGAWNMWSPAVTWQSGIEQGAAA